jgi:hypothetical protein
VLGPQICQPVGEGLHVGLHLVVLLTHDLQVAHDSPANTAQDSTAGVGLRLCTSCLVAQHAMQSACPILTAASRL